MSIAQLVMCMIINAALLFLVLLVYTIVRAEIEDYKMRKFEDHVITTQGMRYIDAIYHD